MWTDAVSACFNVHVSQQWIAVGFCKFPFQIIWYSMRQNAVHTELLTVMLGATNYVDFVED